MDRSPYAGSQVELPLRSSLLPLALQLRSRLSSFGELVGEVFLCGPMRQKLQLK